VKDSVLLEFQDFLLSPPVVSAKNAHFYAHNKKKESRNRAKMVIISCDPPPRNVILCYLLPLEMLY